jgi:hypothetical protein
VQTADVVREGEMSKWDRWPIVHKLRQWQIFISALFAIFILTARADALDINDYNRLDNLWGKFLQLNKDILSVQKDVPGDRNSQALDCFGLLSNNLEAAERSIKSLTMMVLVASKMIDKSDEKTVLDVLSMEARSFYRYVEVGRGYINRAAGECSLKDGFATTAQEALRLYDEATSLVRSMSGVN